MSNIVYRLQTLFAEANLSTVSAREVLGISKTQLGRYLKGFYMPTVQNAIKICNYFECSLDFLLGIDDIKNRFGAFREPQFDLFAQRYQQILDKESITTYELAKQLEINRNNWTYWKKNQTLPTTETLYSIAARFKVSVEYLIGRTDVK